MIDSTLDPPNDSSETLIRITLILIAIALSVAACAPVGPLSTAATSPSEAPKEAPTEPTTGAPPANAVENSPESTGDSAGDASQSGAEGDPEEESGAQAKAKAEKEEKDRKRIVLDTEYDDADVGADQTPRIEAELGLVKDEALNRYVRSVALRLLRHAPARPFNYEFKIVDQSVPNAFALPGGKIYVSRGLLALATTEDELAGVLGHEITHAAERHASARLEYSKRFNPLTIGLLRAARIAAYGRDQERDADRGGQIMAAHAGYDPSGISKFLRKLDAAERYEIGWSRMPSFFATHPTSPERSALALNRASEMTWERSPSVAAKEPDGYFSMVDGLIVGDDPAGGVFDDGNRFVHPELRFALRFPLGWLTMNSQQAVRAISPRRDAQLELTVVGGGDRDLDTIVDEFVESEFDGMTLRVHKRRPIRIGELSAIRIEGRAKTPIGSLAAHMTFVRYNDVVYRLTLLTRHDSASGYRGRARAFAHSFRALDEEGVRSLRVTRLRIARALEDETLQELSIRTRNELEVVFTGVLNGIFASTPLPRRTPVKIGIAEPYLPLPEEPNAPEIGDAASGAEPAEGGTKTQNAETPGDATN